MKYNCLKVFIIAVYMNIIKEVLMWTSTEASKSFNETEVNNITDIENSTDKQTIDKIIQEFIDGKNKKEEIRILTAGQVIDLRNNNYHKSENIPSQQKSGYVNVRYIITTLQSKGFMFIGITDLSKLFKTIRDRLSTTTTTTSSVEVTEEPGSESVTDSRDETTERVEGNNSQGNEKPGVVIPGGDGPAESTTEGSNPEGSNPEGSNPEGTDTAGAETVTVNAELSTVPTNVEAAALYSHPVNVKPVKISKEKQKISRKDKLTGITITSTVKSKKYKTIISTTQTPIVFKEMAWWQNFLAQKQVKKSV